MVFEDQGDSKPIISVVLNRSVKRGQVIIYAETADHEVRVYELDFYGGHNATRLMTKVSNVGGIAPAFLYTPDALILEEAKIQEGALLSELLKEQLLGLPDCTAILHDTFIGYYHNGFLISTESLSRYPSPVTTKDKSFQDGKGRQLTLTPLVVMQFDAIVLRTLELVLEDERAIVKALSSYCSGLNLKDTLVKISEGRSGMVQALHLLYQEMKLYQFMRVERQELAEAICLIASKQSKKAYLDYYSREGYSLKVEEGAGNEDLSTD